MQDAKQKSKSHEGVISRLLILLRIGFGLVFIFSGGVKIATLTEFAKALSAFRIIPEPLISLAAILIPTTEIFIGAAIVLGLRTALMSQLAVAMLVVFTAVIVVKLSEGAEISCACFGPLSNEKMSGATVWRNIILVFWGVLVFAFEASLQANALVAKSFQQQKKAENSEALSKTLTTSFRPAIWKNLQRVIGFLVVFSLVIEVVLLSKQNSELKSRLALLIGDGKNSSVKPGEVVAPFQATDFKGETTKIAYNGVVDKTLLLIFSTSCGACELNLPNRPEIASQLIGDHRRIVGISLNPLAKTKEYVLKNNIKYPVFVSSDTSFIKSYKLFAVPQTILIDGLGRIENIWTGVLDSLHVREVLDKFCSGR